MINSVNKNIKHAFVDMSLCVTIVIRQFSELIFGIFIVLYHLRMRIRIFCKIIKLHFSMSYITASISHTIVLFSITYQYTIVLINT